MSDSHPKMYMQHRVLFRVLCIDSSKSEFLVTGRNYEVIEETDTNFLVRFHSGGAKWYTKTRFFKLY